MALGLPEDHAWATAGKFFAEQYGCEPGECPDGEVLMPVRVCAACAGRAGGRGFPVALAASGELPVIRPFAGDAA